MCFSGRRRHTSWPRDWSSDVCSSDLKRIGHSIFLYKILFVELIQQGNDRRAVPDAFQVKVFALAGGARPGKGDKGCFRQKLPANSFCERFVFQEELICFTDNHQGIGKRFWGLNVCPVEKK